MHIKIDFKIFAFLILFWFTNQIKFYVLLMIFAVLHEIGHLLAGVALNLKPKQIEINPFGLAITFEGMGDKFKENIQKKKIIIALAGPIVNLLFVLLGIIIPLEEIKNMVIYPNLVLIIVNLIPIYPLDGGRILKAFLQMKIEYFKTCQIINTVSNSMVLILTVLASFLIFYFENIAILLMIIYLWILIIQENHRFHLIKKTFSMIQLQKNRLILEKMKL